MRKRRKKNGPVRSKKVVLDGITFASGLEKYMYLALKKAKIKADYEGETFTLIDGLILKLIVTKDNLMEKENLKTEEIKKYYQLNTHQIL